MHVEPSYPSSVTHGGRSTVLGASRAGPVCVFVGLSVRPSPQNGPIYPMYFK